MGKIISFPTNNYITDNLDKINTSINLHQITLNNYPDYRWFFNELVDSHSKNIVSSYTPYNLYENELIEYAYLNYKLSIGCSNGKLKLADYMIDFKLMIMYDENDYTRRRKLIRSKGHPNLIKRINRFDSNFSVENSFVTNIDKKYHLLFDQELIIGFNKTFPKKNIEIKIPRIMNYVFDDELKDLEFIQFIEEMKKGLENEAKELSAELEYKLYDEKFLFKLNETNFEEIIIKMYTEEGFLYSRINKTLRDNDFTAKSFNNLKYYYLSLLYCLQNVSQTLSSDMKVYRVSTIRTEQIDFFQNKCKNKSLILINEILSTTRNESLAKSLLKSKDLPKCLITIKIPKDCDFKLPFLKEFSVFPNEDEILLPYESLLLFNKFERISNSEYYLEFTYINDYHKGLKHFLINTHLNQINLGNNKLGDNGIKNIASALKINKTLNSIQLHFNDIGHDQSIYISDALKFNNTIKEINLDNNNIGDIGAQHISDALRINNSLKVLSLSNNKIEEKGAKFISDSLKINRNLEEVYLYHNNIGDNGLNYLTHALNINSTIKVFFLGSNNIGDLGLMNLSDVLKGNKTINFITLSSNEIGDNGVQYLSNALKINKSLKQIDLGSNNIGLKGSIYITEALKINSAIKEINIGSNKLGDEGIKFISIA